MTKFLYILYGNVIQVVRGYSFLVTVGIVLMISFAFIPAPSANYTTIRFGDFTGLYNSSWVGLSIAMMSSLFLSLFGFYLVNGSIEKDRQTKVGEIIGATMVTNFQYLISKAFSNFIILLLIGALAQVMGIALLYTYSTGFQFNLVDFLYPFLVITCPVLFFTACMSIILESIFGSRLTLQYLCFFVIFTLLLLVPSSGDNSKYSDLFGFKYPTSKIEINFGKEYPQENTNLAFGFLAGGKDKGKIIELKRPSLGPEFILSRGIWILTGFVLVLLGTFFFSRFQTSKSDNYESLKKEINEMASFNIGEVIPIDRDFSIFPFIKIELAMMVLQTQSFLKLLIFISFILLIFMDLETAYIYVLPIIWVLQITNFSSIHTKDRSNRAHYFSDTCLKPISRLAVGRLFAGLIAAILTALPLLIRFMFNGMFYEVISVLLGAMVLISLSFILSALFQNKKPFEIIFFMITFGCLNLLSFTDYFGALHNSVIYLYFLGALSILFLFVGFTKESILKNN